MHVMGTMQHLQHLVQVEMVVLILRQIRSQEELEELGADWDASAALPGYMAELGIPSIADLRPSHIDALIQLAAGHAPDLIAYLLAQPEGLKPTVKRALRAI